jgi:KTSC domain
MTWEKSVISSNVSAIGYDVNTNELFVTWLRNGRVSIYSEVPETLADQLTKAPSVTSMINSDIKPYFDHRYQ